MVFPGDYLAHYADVRDSGQNPFYHSIATGQKEGRRSHFRGEDWEIASREFDVAYYLSLYPDVAAAGIEPVRHYLDTGWHEHRDPAPWFSTRYYLEHNPDIRHANLNPFLHYLKSGRGERRHPSTYARRARLRDKRPRVSVVIPSYNHASFLPERLDFILRQSYDDIEILVIDDASQDQSREIIDQYQRLHSEQNPHYLQRCKFRQCFPSVAAWLGERPRGTRRICESDDSCERNFLDLLVPYFADPSVMIAFGRVQFVDEHGINLTGSIFTARAPRPGFGGTYGSPRRMIGFVARSAFGTSFPMSGMCLPAATIVDRNLAAGREVSRFGGSVSLRASRERRPDCV